MAKHSFPYKPICFKCKARTGEAGKERTEVGKRGGRGRDGRAGGREKRKPAWKRRTGTSGN